MWTSLMRAFKEKVRQLQKLKSEPINRHHRVDKFHHGTDDESNIAFVSKKRHQFYHAFFVTSDGHPMTPDEMAHELNLWIDPTKKFVVKER